MEEGRLWLTPVVLIAVPSSTKWWDMSCTWLRREIRNEYREKQDTEVVGFQPWCTVTV